MNRLFGPICLLLLLSPSLSYALPSDAQQPITITSAQAQFSQDTHVLVYQGNVNVTQGSTQLQAEKLIVHFNNNQKMDQLKALGHPAVISTLTSQKRQRLRACANTIEYNPLLATIHLIEHGHVSQEGNTLEAAHIVIDVANETVVSKPSAQGKTMIVLQPQPRAKPHD